MSNNIVHFAVHADDVGRARKFYGSAFGWSFESWGPPGFFLIRTGTKENPGIMGALHERLEPLEGTGMRGFECTISVQSIESTLEKVKNEGGDIILPPTEIPRVGTMFKFLDTEGNVVVAMQYESPRD